jgi:hypothetical protein
MSRCLAPAASLLAAALLTVPAAVAQKPARAVPLVAGVGVAAPSGKVLYLPGVSGVEAVAVFNGKRLWEAKDAGRPLLATADRVFARAEVKGKRDQLRVVVLDASTGERLLRSDVITFPDWVSVPRDFGLRFHSTARLDKGGLVLLWKAYRFHDGGPPLPAVGADGKPYVDPNAREAAGAVRVDLATGKATPVAGYRPKDDEFPQDEPSWVGDTRLGGWVLRVEESGPDPGVPYALTTRLLRARSARGGRSWERRIAGEPYLPPRP